MWLCSEANFNFQFSTLNLTYPFKSSNLLACKRKSKKTGCVKKARETLLNTTAIGLRFCNGAEIKLNSAETKPRTVLEPVMNQWRSIRGLHESR